MKFPQLICFLWPVTVCSHIKSLVSSEFPLDSPTMKMLVYFFFSFLLTVTPPAKSERVHLKGIVH